ncbi:Hypothetical_protein [Hexamita inflata]|uniref:Hypothetical_protein n=1 Tax=Hexamita inflata TaxID=28002 RepID=A0AA86QJS1_9EUKA|nr:Hypothetical protein HINF_LOCUS48426 [Hexamita inflata]
MSSDLFCMTRLISSINSQLYYKFDFQSLKYISLKKGNDLYVNHHLTANSRGLSICTFTSKIQSNIHNSSRDQQDSNQNHNRPCKGLYFHVIPEFGHVLQLELRCESNVNGQVRFLLLNVFSKIVKTF